MVSLLETVSSGARRFLARQQKEPAMTEPNQQLVEAVARVERQLQTLSDSYEAPSGKIMLRLWANDVAAMVKLSRAALKEQSA